MSIFDSLGGFIAEPINTITNSRIYKTTSDFIDGSSDDPEIQAYREAGGLMGQGKKSTGAPVYEVGEVGPGLEMGPHQEKEGDTDWGGIMQSVGHALSQIEGANSGGGAPTPRVSFQPRKLPAQQYDAGAIQNQMAAQQFQNQAVNGSNLNVPGKQDLNALLGLA